MVEFIRTTVDTQQLVWSLVQKQPNFLPSLRCHFEQQIDLDRVFVCDLSYLHATLEPCWGSSSSHRDSLHCSCWRDEHHTHWSSAHTCSHVPCWDSTPSGLSFHCSFATSACERRFYCCSKDRPCCFPDSCQDSLYRTAAHNSWPDGAHSGLSCRWGRSNLVEFPQEAFRDTHSQSLQYLPFVEIPTDCSVWSISAKQLLFRNFTTALSIHGYPYMVFSLTLAHAKQVRPVTIIHNHASWQYRGQSHFLCGSPVPPNFLCADNTKNRVDFVCPYSHTVECACGTPLWLYTSLIIIK